RRIVLAGLGLNGYPLARAAVETHQAAVLHGGVDGVRIFRIGASVESITAVCDEAIGIGDADGVLGPRRTAEAEVILRAAVDVVERLGIIDRDIVKLRDRQVGLENPILAFVERFVDAAVTA